jgi:DeoR family fructose operon transcriptional repressor
MLAEKRKRSILESLDKKDYVSVQRLARALDVSHMTIRRDLESLEDEGYLIRKYGGALKSRSVESLFSFTRRVNRKKEQKEAICRLAADYIKDNDTVFIDCGTTLFRICKYIRDRKNLRILTNSLPVVSELINCADIDISFIGGQILPGRRASYGAVALKVIKEYHANKAFVGADGISLKNGLSSYDEKEARITKEMAENADEIFLLCDSSKIEKDSFFKFAPVSIIDYLFTDYDISGKLVREYSKNKIKIIISRKGA